jgi:hypothetical protein
VVRQQPGPLSGPECGEFDLGVLKAGGEAAVGMLAGGFELAARIVAFPKPVSEQPSGTASRARIRSAIVSLASRAASTTSSSCKVQVAEVGSDEFQWAYLPWMCSSTRSTRTRCRLAASPGDAWGCAPRPHDGGLSSQ